VFRDESAHIDFALEVIRNVKEEEPDLWDNELQQRVVEMVNDAIECEMGFAMDLLKEGVAGLSSKDMRTYLQYIADIRLQSIGIPAQHGAKNPFDFMELQDAQELANFFERRVSAYQVAVGGSFSLSENF
jgi:ribonucleoside-diphosphate reductase beta chain